VPKEANKAAYVVLLIADPSHLSQPLGIDVPEYGSVTPGGIIDCMLKKPIY
jgi:hypothetical protein